MSIKDALMAEYDHEMAATRRLLERVPDERLGWKPHEKSMSLGGLATHLATIPTWGLTILNDPSFDLEAGLLRGPEKGSRADVLAAFDDSRGRTRAIMDRSDPEYQVLWTLKRGGHEMFSLPRVAAFRTFVLSHSIHHRGQLSVYLRLNDVAVPPIYGPTADEA